MTENVVSMEAGRQKLRERAEAKERFLRRRVAMGLAAPKNVPAPSVLNPEGLPEWPGGIDDLEVGKAEP